MGVKINGVAIPETAVRFELDRLVQFYAQHLSPEQVERQMGLLRRKACEQAIGARLLIDEANRLQLAVPRADVDARLAEMVKRAGGEAQFEELMRKQGLTREAVRRSVEQGRRVDLLVAQVTRDVPAPADEEIQAHYDEHRGEFRKPDRVQARHILITPGSTDDKDRQVARSKLEGIRQRIQDGADFADQAAAFSECPSGRKTGGSLGWLRRGTTVPAFDAAVFSVKVGELSQVIETPLGFHLIQKTAEEAGEEAALEDVRDQVRDFLAHAARGAAIAAFVAELKRKAVIEET